MERLLLSLKDITDNFPDALRSALANPPDASVIVAIPVDPVLRQLASGRVQVSIADLRRVAPAGIFSPDTSQDQEKIDLSLQDLLRKLDPSLLKRRTQRIVALPMDVADLFFKKGETHVEEDAETRRRGDAEMPGEDAETGRRGDAETKERGVPSVSIQDRPLRPSLPEPAPAALKSVAAPADLHALFSAPHVETEVPAPVEPSGLSLKLDHRPNEASFPAPQLVEELPDPGLKLSFMAPKSIEPNPAPAVPPWEDRSAKLSLTPDKGLPVPPLPVSAAPGPAPATPAPAVALPEPAAPLAAPAPRVPGPPAELPAQLVARACALNGVAGAVIALKDGMLVAANVPPELKAETLAAFLPQVFGRVEQAATAMEIGSLQTLMFTAGGRPWQIWDAGSVFFAALGRPNELLPGAQLKVIAAQLTRQSK